MILEYKSKTSKRSEISSKSYIFQLKITRSKHCISSYIYPPFIDALDRKNIEFLSSGYMLNV